MDERKKSGSSGEEAVRVGPYRVKEQVPQDEYNQGSLYRARHETSGTPALVLERATRNENEEEDVHEAVGRMVDAFSGSPAPSLWRYR